jgi:tRNA uridine 5-carboxymethylaminomethyl modification enzyme
MIDDLTSRGVTEPYRMFTSRAEFRLTVRADNADRRLTPIGVAAGCVSEARRIAFDRKVQALEEGKEQLKRIAASPRDLAATGIAISQDGGKRTLFEALSFPGADLTAITAAFDAARALDRDILQQLQIEATYGQFAERQAREVADLRRQETQRIPADFDYAAISGLSNELKQKLMRIRPETMHQAGQIEGATPASLLLVLAHLRKPRAEQLAG